MTIRRQSNIKARQIAELRRRRVRKMFSPACQEALERADRWSRRFELACKVHLYAARCVVIGLLLMVTDWEKLHHFTWGLIPAMVVQAGFCWFFLVALSKHDERQNKHG